MPQALVGHSYFLWTLDSDSDYVTLFEVTAHRPGDRCELDWCWTEDGSFSRGSARAPAGASRSLAAAALALRTAARLPFAMQSPRVVLQARGGAVGGNPCEVDLSGFDRGYFRSRSRQPLSLDGPIETSEEMRYHSSGGLIPHGRRYVVTHLRWRGQANGDSNGTGHFEVRVDGKALVESSRNNRDPEPAPPQQGEWRGRLVLEPGQEDRVLLVISNSSYGELVANGHFEDAK